jgi:hypothetical protein
MLSLYRDVFKSFQSHKVKYVVIGGIAAIVHGVPRTTLDLDVLIEPTPENAQRVLDALTEIGFGTATLTTAENVARNDVTILKDWLRVDIHTHPPGLTFATAWKNRTRRRQDRHTVLLASISDLIRAKKAAGRPHDLEDARLLQLKRHRKKTPR